MKKLMVIVLAGWVLVISQGIRRVAAEQGWTPLEEVAGTYAATVQGTVFVCFQENPPHAPAQCGSAGSTGIPISINHIGVFTLDAAGNGCATLAVTHVHSPVDATPTGVG